LAAGGFMAFALTGQRPRSGASPNWPAAGLCHVRSFRACARPSITARS